MPTPTMPPTVPTASRDPGPLELLLWEAILYKDLPKVLLLLSDGADPSFRQARGDHWTSAMAACHVRRPDILGALVSAGADLSAVNRFGMNACHFATVESSPDCLELLIRAGADVHSPDQRRNRDEAWTPAMWAARHGRPECLALLMRAGADLSAMNRSGQDALRLARYVGHVECCRIIEAWLERQTLQALTPLGAPPIRTGRPRI